MTGRRPDRRAPTLPTAPAFAVCVWTMSGRTLRMMRARRHAASASRSGDSSRESPRQRNDLDAGLLRDELHRLLAARDVAGDERRLVAAVGEPARQVRDVERRASDVESRDHPHHPDRPPLDTLLHRGRA